MPQYDPKIVADALVLNALDHTRSEIADKLNQRHGTDYSNADISEMVNAVEDEGRSGDEFVTFAQYYIRGNMAGLMDDVPDSVVKNLVG